MLGVGLALILMCYRATQAVALRKLGLPEATLRGIASGNAMNLVPRLKV